MPKYMNFVLTRHVANHGKIKQNLENKISILCRYNSTIYVLRVHGSKFIYAHNPLSNLSKESEYLPYIRYQTVHFIY